MKNASWLDVERVKNGEFVPNVMFTTNGGTKIHMKECVLESVFNLHEGQKIFETADGKLYIIHLSNLLPIKKHSFSSNDPKKVKRKPVKGGRKYVKVACKQVDAVALAKKQGWVTFEFEESKVKRYFNSTSYSWMNKYGVSVVAAESTEDVYDYMYVPVEISPKCQATINAALSQSINQFAEDAKLGEVMRKAGWRINEGKIPVEWDKSVTVMRRDSTTLCRIATRLRWPFCGDNTDIIAYQIVE